MVEWIGVMNNNNVYFFKDNKYADDVIQFMNNNEDLKGEYLKKFSDASKNQGYAIVLSNLNVKDYKEFDIKYRKKLNYKHVYFYNHDEKEDNERFSINYDEPEVTRISKFNNFHKLSIDGMSSFDDIIARQYELDSRKKKNSKIQHDKRILLYNIHEYLKTKEYFTSKEIAKKFNISIRNVQRYMWDINLLYNDIGYNYTTNEYYVCK